MKATLLGAAFLACAFAVQAQTTPAPSAEPQKGSRHEHRQQMKERMKAAHEACKDKPDRRACMGEQMCAKAPDPAKCMTEGKQRMAQHMEKRQKMHEACNGKRGDELTACLKAQRKEHRGHKPETK